MVNIERRRRIRTAASVAAAIGLLLLLGGVIAVAVIKPFSHSSALPSDEPNISPEPATAVPTVIPTADPSESATPVPTAELTAAPTAEPTEEPIETPASTGPIRISDDLSTALVLIDIKVRYDAEGRPWASVKGSLSLDFINNTDSVLYSIELLTGSLKIDSVTVNGFAANFVSEDGKLSIPLFNELTHNASCLVYLEFSAKSALEDSVFLPQLGYDSPYLLTAYIDSAVALTIDGADYSITRNAAPFGYSVEDASVRGMEIRFVD